MKSILISIFISVEILVFGFTAENAQSYFKDQLDIKVPILLYHNIMENYPNDQSVLNISPSVFEGHMKALKDAGYNTITFEEFYNFATSHKPLPEKPILITFDDGYSSNYQYAYPLLKKLSMKATIFVVTSRVGFSAGVDGVTNSHFSWEQAKEMQESGVISIESHSQTHPIMTGLSDELANMELRVSSDSIKKYLNKSSYVFAYPYGLYNNNLQNMAEKAGYKMQVIVDMFGINTKAESLHELRRLTINGHTSGKDLIQLIEKNISTWQFSGIREQWNFP